MKGAAYFELKDYANASREYASYVRDHRKSDETADERDLYVIALNQLMLSYYNSDELQKSLEVSSILLDLAYSPELMEFQSQVKRELGGNKTRLSESSDHFKAIYDGYEHGQVDRKVLAIMEDAYRDIGQQLGYYPSASLTVVLDTKESFHDITRSPRWSAAVFMDGRVRIPVGGIETFDGGEIRRILYHEYTHALIYSITTKCPRWLHEGLAEYFSRGPSAISGKPGLPLHVIEAAFYSHDIRTVLVAYTESARAVKALVDQYGLYTVKLYIQALSEGMAPDTAFKEKFYITEDDFLQRYGQ